MPSHFLNQHWNIVNWTLGNKLQWNFNHNSYIFFQEMHLKMSSGKWQPFCLDLNVLNDSWKLDLCYSFHYCAVCNTLLSFFTIMQPNLWYRTVSSNNVITMMSHESHGISYHQQLKLNYWPFVRWLWFLSQMASNAGIIPMWWNHHGHDTIGIATSHQTAWKCLSMVG